MERKILHQKIQMPAYWWLCTRQIVLGAQLAAIYVDVHSGIKSEKKYCYLPLRFFLKELVKLTIFLGKLSNYINMIFFHF